MSIVRYKDGLVNEFVVEERNLGDINEQVFLRWAQEVNEGVAVLLSTLTHLVHLTLCSVKELYLSSTCRTSGKPNGMVEQIKPFLADSIDPLLSDEH